MVHPLVLLSVVDHYNRVAKDTRKRVIGLLLGETHRGRTDVTNSFAGASDAAIARACSRHGLPSRPRTRAMLKVVCILRQCLSRRMTGTLPSGFWTTATWRTCSTCTSVSMVRTLPPRRRDVNTDCCTHSPVLVLYALLPHRPAASPWLRWFAHPRLGSTSCSQGKGRRMVSHGSEVAAVRPGHHRSDGELLRNAAPGHLRSPGAARTSFSRASIAHSPVACLPLILYRLLTGFGVRRACSRRTRGCQRQRTTRRRKSGRYAALS